MVTSSLVFATYWPRWKTNKKRFYQASRLLRCTVLLKEWQIFGETGLNVKNLMVVETPHPYPAKTHSWTKVSWVSLEGFSTRGRLGKQLRFIPLNVKWPLLEWHMVIWGNSGWSFFIQDDLTISHPLFSEIPIAGRACKCFACVLKTEPRVFSYCSESLLHVCRMLLQFLEHPRTLISLRS